MSTVNIAKLKAGQIEALLPGESVPPSHGGTGVDTYAVGDMLVASGAATLARLPSVVIGSVLVSAGLGASPIWGKVGLDLHVSGILPVANGGTGLSSYALGSYLVGGNGAIQQLTPAQVLANIQAAPATHSHSTDSITSGVFETGRLGSGVADITKYLRGDGTWVTMPGGGGTLVSSISVVTNAGVSGTVTPGTDASITITLGEISPLAVNVTGSVDVGTDLTVIGNTSLGNTINSVVEFGVHGAMTTFSTSTTGITAGQVLASIDGSVYRSGEFRIQAFDSAGNRYHTATVLVVHDGTTANYTEYGDIDLGGRCGNFGVDFVGGHLRLYVNPLTSNIVQYKIVATLTKL